MKIIRKNYSAKSSEIGRLKRADLFRFLGGKEDYVYMFWGFITTNEVEYMNVNTGFKYVCGKNHEVMPMDGELTVWDRGTN